MTETQAHFPTLETERLVLRAFIDEDVEFLYRHFSDPAVTEYLYDSPPFTERSEARGLIEFYRTRSESGPNRWGIVKKADNTIIGTCGYHNWARPYHRAEIGYDLGPQAWGHGYMIEALRAVAAHGFGKMSLNRIEALVFAGNTASIRLLEKLGFEGEGVLRDYFFLNNTFYDHRIFSLLKRDWVAR